jgi:hypothetical protein
MKSKSKKTTAKTKAEKTSMSEKTTLKGGNVRLTLGAVLEFEDGAGMQFQEPVYFKPEKQATKEDIIKSLRESVAALEYQISRQIGQRSL